MFHTYSFLIYTVNSMKLLLNYTQRYNGQSLFCCHTRYLPACCFILLFLALGSLHMFASMNLKTQNFPHVYHQHEEERGRVYTCVCVDVCACVYDYHYGSIISPHYFAETFLFVQPAAHTRRSGRCCLAYDYTKDILHFLLFSLVSLFSYPSNVVQTVK